MAFRLRYQVEKQLKGLVDGSLKPDDVVLPGEDDDSRRRRKMTAEQRAADDARREAERQNAIRLKNERRVRELREEHDKWWEKARFHFGAGGVEREQSADGLPSAKRDAKEMYRRGLDYDRWSSWTPSDPASKEEEAKRQAEIDAEKDKEFEKLNPEFCEQVVDDIQKRKASNEEKASKAAKLKDKANGLFREGKYARAITVYHQALELKEWEVPLMTNLAMAHLKLGELDFAEDHCNRALLVNPRWVKAYYRRALVHEAKSPPDLEAAVADLQKAVDMEPSNGDLVKELERVRTLLEESRFEAEVLARAKAEGASGEAAPEPQRESRPVDPALTIKATIADAGDSGAAAATGGAGGGGGGASAAAAAVPAPKASPPPPTPATEAAPSKAAATTPSPPSAPASSLSPFQLVDRVVGALRTLEEGGEVSVDGVKADLRRLAAILDNAELRTYFRSTGGLRMLCTEFRTARRRQAGAEASDDGASSGAPGPFDDPQVQEAACLALGTAGMSAPNEAVIREYAGLEALVDTATDSRDDFLTVATAARSALELVTSHEKSRVVVSRNIKLLKATLATVERCANALNTDATKLPDTGVLEAGAKAASLVQIVALQQSSPRVIEALTGAVTPLLRLVAGATMHMLLDSTLMQSTTAALANLAHHAPLRAMFARPIEGVGEVPGVQALLALLVLPVPSSEGLTVVRGSAVAALSNAGLETAEVRQALCDCNAVEGLLAALEGKGAAAAAIPEAAAAAAAAKPKARGKKGKRGRGGAGSGAAAAAAAAAGKVEPLPPVLAERCAALLARLTQQPDGLATMAKEKNLRRLVALLNSSEIFGEARQRTEDPLIRCLAGAMTTPEQVAAVVDAGVLPRLGAILAEGLPDTKARATALGNLTKCVITMTNEATNKYHGALLSARFVENLIELLKRAGAGPVRKNAAVALARLARDKDCLAKIRELDGMKILMQLGRELM